MKDFPLVSVIIPTYSRPVYLKRCVDSVLNQTYSPIEIIVVDDNDPNTDERQETEKTMSDYQGFNRIIYLQHDKNRNASAARNTGWRAANGEYVTFLDDDDEIAKTKIAEQVKCLESLDDSWGMCYTGYRVLKEHGNDQISSEKRSGNCYIDALMRTMFLGSGSNLFLRKKVVEEIDGFDESFQRNQDVEFLARACELYKLAYVDDVLLNIHQEGNRPNRTFEQIEGYTKHYLERFENRINSLGQDDRERVIAVISLERFRIAVVKRHFITGLRILKDNKVKIKYRVRYVRYLLKRVITRKSYGFNGM